MMLRQVISGGQVGVDQIALRVAYDLGIKTGGHIPDGFVTSKGKQPQLGLVYGLEELGKPELNPIAAYIMRSKKNVDHSDATLAFRFHMSPGTDQTIGYCVTGKWNEKNSKIPSNINERDSSTFHKPIYVVSVISYENMDQTRDTIVRFLSHHKVKKLNVAGHRELEGNQAILIELLLYKVFCKCKEL